MRRRRRGLIVLVVGSCLVVVGCATPLTVPAWEITRLLNRASYDLECAGSQLQMTTIDDKTRSVYGCGRQATYVQLCDAPVYDPARSCVWVMNNGSRDSFQ